MRILLLTMTVSAGLLSQGCSSSEDLPHEHARFIDEVSGVEKVEIPVAGGDYQSLTAFHRAPRIEPAVEEKLRVIIIPGTPSNVGFWGEAIEKIDERAEVYGIERAGFRKSGPGHAVTNLEEHAKIVGALTKDYDGRTIVIGQSYGAAVALTALRRYGDTIDGVVLVSPYVIPMSGKKKLLFTIARLSPLRFIGGGATNRIVRELSAYERQAPLVLETVGQTCKSVTIVYGKADDLVPPEDVERLSGLFPDCADIRTETIENGDHYLQVHSLGPLLSAINGFLGERLEGTRRNDGLKRPPGP